MPGDLRVRLLLQAVDKVTAPVRGITRSFDRMARRVTGAARRASRSMDGIARAARRAGKAGRTLALRLTAPIVLAGGAIAKTGADFSETLAQIEGLVGVNRSQVGAWRGDLLRLAPAVAKGPRELAKALFFITSAGARGGEAIDTLTASARASAAGLGATADIAQAVTSAVNAYGAANLGAGKATGILVATVREGKAEASSIAGVLGRILPIASQLGVGFDEVGASIAAMTRLGSNAEQSVTQLRGVLTAILKPADLSRRALKFFGLSSKGLKRQLREQGLLSVLKTLKERFGDNQRAMTAVFPDVEGLAGVFSLVGKNAAVTERIFASLAGATENDLAKAFRVAQREPNFKFRRSLAALQVLMIRLSETLLPAVVAVADRITSVVVRVAKAFKGLSPGTKQFIVAVVAVVAAIAPLLLVLATLGFALTGIVAVWAVAKTVVLALSGALFGPLAAALRLIAAAILAHPIVAFVTAIALAALLIVKHWRPIDEFMGRLWRRIKGWFDLGVGLIDEKVGELIDLVPDLTKAWERVPKFFDDIWSGIIDNLKAVQDLLPSFTKSSFGITGPARLTEQVRRVSGPRAGAAAAGVAPGVGGAGTLRVGFDGRIVVQFEDAPPGTRVREVTSSRPDIGIDVDMGYVMDGI